MQQTHQTCESLTGIRTRRPKKERDSLPDRIRARDDAEDQLRHSRLAPAVVRAWTMGQIDGRLICELKRSRARRSPGRFAIQN